MRNEVLINRSLELAELAIDLSDQLENINKKPIAIQVLKSGTSIGANINESTNAESILDYIHKISIANKELSEFEYWINLCKKKELILIDDDIFSIVKHLQKTITRLIYTSRKELERQENLKKTKKTKK